MILQQKTASEALKITVNLGNPGEHTKLGFVKNFSNAGFGFRRCQAEKAPPSALRNTTPAASFQWSILRRLTGLSEGSLDGSPAMDARQVGPVMTGSE